MSPLTLRRYRAERLLRTQFERLRRQVLAGVSARLRAAGVRLDDGDLEACYSQAWQGLYATVLDGGEIDSPEAWLAQVTYRRAIDEHRARGRLKRVASDVGRLAAAGDAPHTMLAGAGPGEQRDLAERLDDNDRLRHLFEALRGRLSKREQQAATLCYLHGLTRAEAAAQMGVSERRMSRLMDGRGGDAGVAAKVGTLVETIAADRWCAEQASLMRGFAYGILDPRGERYRLAEAHRAGCPACRAYVLSLRGLAAVLPPLPALAHALACGGAAAGGGVAGGSAGAGGSGASALAGAASAGSTFGALSASGAAGAGGGWWLAGGLGAKLAAGCLIALGVGAGCVELGGGPASVHGRAQARRATARRAFHRRTLTAGASATQTLAATASAPTPTPAAAAPAGRSASGASRARQAAREFGPEQSAGGGGGGAGSTTTTAPPLAR
ncbi:MAG: hypothetical protein QOF54_947, partial [Solirubrobacteraceae bacterium]|nr:hypothetical protein [Solirubrobacteraceae bacterium]